MSKQAVETAPKAKKPSGLDLRFHVSERGSTVGQEIKAGFSAFCIATCAVLMNTQIIGSAYGNYAGAYLATALIAFIGSLLLGIICNMPVQQSANLGLASVMITMLGTDTGLTYANLMLVCFVGALAYLAVMLTPLKKVLLDAIPSGVLKALPAGIGGYVVLTALQNSGILTADGALATASSFSKLKAFYFWLMLAGLAVYVLVRGLGRKGNLGFTFWMLIAAMWVCGILFFMETFIGGQTATTLVYERVNLIFATDGADPYNIVTGFQSLQIGKLFTEGLDFTAYTEAGGNVVTFFLKGVLTFLFLGLYTNVGVVRAVEETSDNVYDAAAEQKALTVSAAMNVVAPLLGAAPSSLAVQSTVASEDGARTGLSSLAAAVGYLITLFTWAFYALFATTTNGVGMWISETETKLTAYVQDGFAFADFIMVIAGAAMIKSALHCDTKNKEEFVPFAITLVCTALLGNVALGVALGVVAYIVLKVTARQWKELNKALLPVGAVLLLYAILALA